MKAILTLAFVLAAGSALASGDPPPKGQGKSAMAKSPPPVVQVVPGQTREACLADIRQSCIKTHRTVWFTARCIRVNRYQCK